MDESVHSVLDLDERAEVRQVSDAPVHAVADLEALRQRLPGVRLRLLHAEADAAVLRVNAEHFDLYGLAGLDELAGVLHALRPCHLRDVNQAFDAGFEFDERAVVCDGSDLALHALARREALGDRLPRVWKELLVTE